MICGRTPLWLDAFSLAIPRPELPALLDGGQIVVVRWARRNQRFEAVVGFVKMTKGQARRDKRSRSANELRLGSNHPHARLTEDQVKKIRSLQGKMSAAAIGKQFGVHKETVASILRRENWGWLT